MIEIVALTVLVLLGWAALTAGLVLLKAVLWLILLPIRLVFYLLLLPLLLIKAVIGGLLFLVIGPIVAIGLFAGLIALVVGLVVPLLPLAFVVLAVWFLVRLTRGAPAPTRA